MQAENNKTDIKTLSFGCRLNALESEKIQKMLSGVLSCAIVVNTCGVTAEAERQSGQTVRKLARENPNVPIFVTGCAATRNPELFATIPNTMVIHNRDKMQLSAYLDAMQEQNCHIATPQIVKFTNSDTTLSKQYVQVQNGCNHKCAYCVTRLLRGPAVSFYYADILADATNGIKNGFTEIVLTGVDIASYARDGMLISDVCKKLLNDLPQIQRLRLSSMDPASPQIPILIEMMKSNPRMMGHLHLSMQSGSDPILFAMHRRHNADMVRKIVALAGKDITFSWDIICGFAGETDELFNQTANLARELGVIKVHAFPFSPRPDTEGAILPHQIDRNISKQRVKIITEIADENRRAFMSTKVGTTAQILVEENNIGRTPDDISVRICGERIPAKTVCNVKLTDIVGDEFIGEII